MSKQFFKPDSMEVYSESVGPIVGLRENKNNIIRLHQVTCFYDDEMKPKIGEFRSQKFKAPKGMCRYEVFKLLSYLADFVEEQTGIIFNHINAVLVLEGILEFYHFKKLDSFDTTPATDYFFVMDELDAFYKTNFTKRFFKWYIEGVTIGQVKEIYKRLNLSTDKFLTQLNVEYENNERTL